MTLEQLLTQRRAALAAAQAAIEAAESAQRSILAEAGETLTDEQSTRFDEQTDIKNKRKAELSRLEQQVTEAERAVAEEDELVRSSGDKEPGAKRAADKTREVSIGREERTYGHSDMSRREKSRMMKRFLSDVARANHFNDHAASLRLQRHQEEERTERAEWFEEQERAAGTAAFSGLVVPQYLVDLVAPAAQALRPLADAINGHDLPAEGMTLNISRITTSTSTGVQANEGDAASEQDIDDTLLAVSVQTNAGQQTLSRQAVERGVGTEDILMQDLVTSYQTRLDATLITQAANGLSAAAGATVAYTDASPTAAELYPKLLDAASRVEAGLLGLGMADIAVMHSRRWYWLQSQLSSSWPLFGQPNLAVQQGGANFGEVYGKGFRGQLPNGLNVIVDNNIATNLGAGVNEDEIYVGASAEMHLWEDPDAPLFIRTEEVKAATLQILFVLYGYFAYTFGRYPAATAKIGGTGLVTPTF